MDQYKPDELKEMKVGEKSSTVVTEIKDGSMGEFMSDGYWANTKIEADKIPEAKLKRAIEVETANGAKMVISLPPGDEVNPKSNLGLWKKTYGDYPKKGQNVSTKIDDNGFNKIVLEK